MDSTEFKDLFLPLHKGLYYTALHLMGNSMDAEDMVQEAFLKLWEGRDGLTDIKSAEAFAYTTVRNLCLNTLRTMHDDGQPEDTPDAEGEDGSLQRLTEARDEARLMHQLISRLPDRERRVMTMRDVNGASYDDIARRTGLNAVHIRVLLCRARQKIRKRFNEYMNYHGQE